MHGHLEEFEVGASVGQRSQELELCLAVGVSDSGMNGMSSCQEACNYCSSNVAGASSDAHRGLFGRALCLIQGLAQRVCHVHLSMTNSYSCEFESNFAQCSADGSAEQSSRYPVSWRKKLCHMLVIIVLEIPRQMKSSLAAPQSSLMHDQWICIPACGPSFLD